MLALHLLLAMDVSCIMLFINPRDRLILSRMLRVNGRLGRLLRSRKVRTRIAGWKRVTGLLLALTRGVYMLLCRCLLMHRVTRCLLMTSVRGNVALVSGMVTLLVNRLNVILRILVFGWSPVVASRSMVLNLRRLRVAEVRGFPRIGLCVLVMIWIRLRLFMVYGLYRFRRFRRLLVWLI